MHNKLSRRFSILLSGLLYGLYCVPASSANHTAAGEAGHIVSPESIDGVIKVDADGLIEKALQMPELVLIDSRVPADRAEGFIEGSISLPDVDTSCATLAQVVPRPDTPLLFYCNGIRCGRSAVAAVVARDCGYSNLYWFRNGMEEWQEKQYPLVQ
jgi:rhodanese-related sulfurtransferase